MRGDSQHVEHSVDTRSEDCVARMSRTVLHVNSVRLESMPFLSGRVSNGDGKTNQRLL